MVDVIIYTKAGCPYCAKANQLLARKNIPYREIDAGSDPAMRAQMTEQAHGRSTFPQIFINALHIGGCDDLYALEKDGRLDHLPETESR